METEKPASNTLGTRGAGGVNGATGCLARDGRFFCAVLVSKGGQCGRQRSGLFDCLVARAPQREPRHSRKDARVTIMSVTVRKTTMLAGVLVLALLFGVLAMFGSKPAAADTAGNTSGDGVVPELISGNPDCADLGYDFGFKPQPEPPPTGTYTDGTLTVDIVSDGQYFDWTSNIAVDAVIVKGGSNADAFVYEPEDKNDTDLHAPLATNGQPRNISHIEFCYDLELQVTKDANTSFKRTNDWKIDKSVSPDEWDLFKGDSGTSGYTVSVDKTVTESDYKVSGTISVYNPAPFAANIMDVSDVVSGVGAAAVDCGGSFPITLASKDTLECTYNASLPDKSGRTNTATATLQNYDYDSAGQATADGTTDFPGTANVDFSNATVDEIDESIDVTDSLQGALGTVDASQAPKTFQYSRNVGPYQECGDYTVDNTASFVTNDTGTTGDDNWTVDINVPCNGCTLTIGYWKTHADPASTRMNPDYTLQLLAQQPDGTIWLGTPNGAKSVAVTSSNVVSILKFDGSNGIKKLQAQLLGAKLNIANSREPSGRAEHHRCG